MYIMDTQNTNPIPPPSIEEAKSRLLNMPVNTENDALNVIVSFLNIAQRRGCFGLDESAKIFECIKRFQKPSEDRTLENASV